MNHTLSITNKYGYGYYYLKTIYFEYYIMNLAIYIYIYIMGTKCVLWVQAFKCS